MFEKDELYDTYRDTQQNVEMREYIIPHYQIKIKTFLSNGTFTLENNELTEEYAIEIAKGELIDNLIEDFDKYFEIISVERTEE